MDGWWNEFWMTFTAELTTLPDGAAAARVSARLIVASALGALLGYERECNGSSAGLRTHMLVALGAALFVIVPLQVGTSINDMSRVLQGLIAGIGFLGAGSIIKHNQDGEITGLTTAAGIWLTAAIGVAAGMGLETTAVLSTLLAIVILSLLKIRRRTGRAGDAE